MSGFNNQRHDLWIELETAGSNECEREGSNQNYASLPSNE